MGTSKNLLTAPFILSLSKDETLAFASEFSSKLKKGDVIALTGDLGAGKTCFVQGMAYGIGVRKNYYVNSPTFTILNVYEGGKFSLYHFDWYRLTSEAEAADLGFEEYFDGAGISVIEWAEKFPNLLPDRTIWIKMETVDENVRKIIIPPFPPFKKGG